MYDIPGAIKSFCDMVAKILGLRSQQVELKNPEAAKDKAKAAQEQKVVDDARKAVEQGKDDDFRKMVSVLVASAVLAFGCSACVRTVVPPPVAAATVAWDGTNHNAGVVGHTPDHRMVVAPSARDRYNALAAEYGSRYKPPMPQDWGLTPTVTNTWLMDPEACVRWAQMAWWERQKPKQ